MASKECTKCQRLKNHLEFPRSRAPWFTAQTSDVCYACLEALIEPRDLASVDHVLQYLDIQFSPDDWIEAVELNEKTALETYVTKMYAHRNTTHPNWQAANAAWREREAAHTLDSHIGVMNQERLAALRKRWGDYSPEEFEVLEGFYENVQHTQNVITAIQQDQAENMARLSLLIRRKIQAGEDASKDIKAFNDYIKSAGFEPKNARNYGDFQSIGELINFLVKKGYTPTFYHQKPAERDLVDLTMKNNQSYLRRLVHNEPGLQDLVQQRKLSYKVAQQLENDGLDDQALEKYDVQTAQLDYQGTSADLEALIDG